MPPPNRDFAPTNPHRPPSYDLQMSKALANASGSVDVMINVDRRSGSCSGQDGSSLPLTSWRTDKDVLVNGGGCFHFGAGSKAKPMSDDGGCEKRGGALFVVP